ncbi:MAG: hypothetical protein J5835_02555 [Bacteroidales bacterium]|nr:hypothetical protein [Bacteroidales bacterium]
MKKTMFYKTPVTELLVVRFEENILSGADAFHEGGGGYYGGDDTNDNGDY